MLCTVSGFPPICISVHATNFVLHKLKDPFGVFAESRWSASSSPPES